MLTGVKKVERLKISALQLIKTTVLTESSSFSTLFMPIKTLWWTLDLSQISVMPFFKLMKATVLAERSSFQTIYAYQCSIADS